MPSAAWLGFLKCGPATKGQLPRRPFIRTWQQVGCNVSQMNRETARILIDEESGSLRKLPCAELLKMVDKTSTNNVKGPDGKQY